MKKTYQTVATNRDSTSSLPIGRQTYDIDEAIKQYHSVVDTSTVLFTLTNCKIIEESDCYKFSVVSSGNTILVVQIITTELGILKRRKENDNNG